jgi:hypothetical protein
MYERPRLVQMPNKSISQLCIVITLTCMDFYQNNYIKLNTLVSTLNLPKELKGSINFEHFGEKKAYRFLTLRYGKLILFLHFLSLSFHVFMFV